MKKTVLLSTLIMAVLVFSYCSSTKKATVAAAPKLTTYDANVAPVVMANCTPCHFPDKGGRKKPLDNYNAVSSQIDDMLRRIQLNPADRGFMPDKHAKLADSTIAMFKQWKADGLVK